MGRANYHTGWTNLKKLFLHLGLITPDLDFYDTYNNKLRRKWRWAYGKSLEELLDEGLFVSC